MGTIKIPARANLDSMGGGNGWRYRTRVHLGKKVTTTINFRDLLTVNTYDENHKVVGKRVVSSRELALRKWILGKKLTPAQHRGIYGYNVTGTAARVISAASGYYIEPITAMTRHPDGGKIKMGSVSYLAHEQMEYRYIYDKHKTRLALMGITIYENPHYEQLQLRDGNGHIYSDAWWYGSTPEHTESVYQELLKIEDALREARNKRLESARALALEVFNGEHELELEIAL